MRIQAWILLGIVGIFSLFLFVSGVTSYSAKASVYDIADSTYLDVIDQALGKNNAHFLSKNFTIENTQYIEDSVVVLETRNTVENKQVFFIFEYYNDTLFLTNYSDTGFSEVNFNHPYITDYVVNALNQ